MRKNLTNPTPYLFMGILLSVIGIFIHIKDFQSGPNYVNYFGFPEFYRSSSFSAFLLTQTFLMGGIFFLFIAFCLIVKKIKASY